MICTGWGILTSAEEDDSQSTGYQNISQIHKLFLRMVFLRRGNQAFSRPAPSDSSILTPSR